MRLLVTLGTFAIAFSLAIATTWTFYGDAAVEKGRGRQVAEELLVAKDLLIFEKLFHRTFPPRPRQQPLVVWLGDSTIWPPPKPYPVHLAKATEGRAINRVVALPGLDFFSYYALLGRILEEPPEVVVMVANLRLFLRSRDDATFRLLSAMIPGDELPRTMLLPLYTRDLTIARLLLNRILRFEGARTGFYFYEGLRVLFQESETWKELVPETPPVRRPKRSAVDRYSPSLDPWHPAVRMMKAAVRFATRRGARVIVLAIPIPYELLESKPGYSPEAEADRVRVLREAVQESGGVFLDLHRALRGYEFRWAGLGGAHYTVRGSKRMAELVLPTLDRELGSLRTRSRVGE